VLITRLYNFLERSHLPRQATLALGVLLTGLIGLADYVTGYEIGLSVFYVLPVALTCWLAGRRPGLFVATLSAAIWLTADLASGHVYSHLSIAAWNTLIRLTFFVIITLLLAALRNAMRRTEELSRIDELTGVANSRYFYAILENELNRLERYGRPLTLAYVDLDGFKTVNDTVGHLEGDAVLRVVAASAKTHLRKTDVVARLGGDEFALLCPETDEVSAQAVMSKTRHHLTESMESGGWPVTFSIGAVVCYETPERAEALVKMADDVMYSVKTGGKDSVGYATFKDRTLRPFTSL
jgi:diguanylate cyclase (GGDEF)-like protein